MESNQYLFVFDDQDDGADGACIDGGWEYDAVAACLGLGADYLASTDTIRSKKFTVGPQGTPGVTKSGYSMDVSVEIVRPQPDDPVPQHRLTLKLGPYSREPFFWGDRRPGLNERTFRLYRSEEQLLSIGKMLAKLDKTVFTPIMTSTVNDWFLPRFLNSDWEAQWIGLAERSKRAVDHIKKECPDALAKIWVNLIQGFELPVMALCPKCNKQFPRYADERWRKVCLGCYTKKAPTSYTQEQIDASGCIPSWLAKQEAGTEGQTIATTAT